MTAIRPDSMTVPAKAESPEEQPVKVRHTVKALSDDIKAVAEHWSGISGPMEPFLEQYLRKATVSVEDDSFFIISANGFNYTYMNSEDTVTQLEKVISDTIGKEVEVRIKEPDINGKESFEDIRDLKGLVNFDIQEEDEQ